MPGFAAYFTLSFFAIIDADIISLYFSMMIRLLSPYQLSLSLAFPPAAVIFDYFSITPAIRRRHCRAGHAASPTPRQRRRRFHWRFIAAFRCRQSPPLRLIVFAADFRLPYGFRFH
jgi:hypothetical protein